jgi:predicted Zn-dependent peptidase
LKKTFQTIISEGKKFNFLALPASNYFKIEIVNHIGSNIERVYESLSGKNVYGLSHLVEHLAFKSSKDFTTEEILNMGKNSGSYNAGTTYDYIDYFFETTSENNELAIKYVFNVAYNDLKNISDEEFASEKNVVYNEAKRYADDDQTMFYYKAGAVAAGYHDEDYVIGIPETIATFCLEDAINIKNLFLQNQNITFNICYDPTRLSQEEIINKISMQLKRFEPVELGQYQLDATLYKSMLKFPRSGKFLIDSQAEQAMNMFMIPLQADAITSDFVSKYLESFADKTSLNDVIREQNGLTYGIEAFLETFSHRPYLLISCDVSMEEEEKFIRLFRESINNSVDNFNQEAYEKFIDAARLKRILAHVNLIRYEAFFQLDKIDSTCLEPYRDTLLEDVDEAYAKMYQLISFEVMQKNLEIFRKTINENSFARMSNV